MPDDESAFEISATTFVVLLREVSAELGIAIRQIDANSAQLEYRDDKVSVSFANIRPRLASATSLDEAREMLKGFVSSVVSARNLEDRRRQTFDDVRDRLMPRIGRPFAPDVMPEPLPAHTLVGELQINLVGDEPDIVWYVTHDHLAGWGVDFYEALAVATRNLRERTTAGMLVPVDDLPHFLVCETGDTYDAARMLILKDMLPDWPDAGVVVCTPTRDALLLTALRDAESLRSMHVMMDFGHDLFGKDGYAISDQPMWYDGQQWELLPVTFGDNRLDLYPGERFVEALNRLAGLDDDEDGGDDYDDDFDGGGDDDDE